MSGERDISTRSYPNLSMMTGIGRCQNSILIRPPKSTKELSQVESDAPLQEHVTHILKHHQGLAIPPVWRTTSISQHSKPPSGGGGMGLWELLCKLLICRMTQSPIYSISLSFTQQIFLHAYYVPYKMPRTLFLLVSLWTFLFNLSLCLF